MALVRRHKVPRVHRHALTLLVRAEARCLTTPGGVAQPTRATHRAVTLSLRMRGHRLFGRGQQGRTAARLRCGVVQELETSITARAGRTRRAAICLMGITFEGVEHAQQRDGRTVRVTRSYRARQA